MVGRRPILGGSSRERHVGPQDGLESGLMNLLLRQNSNAQLSSQGRAYEIKNPSRIIRRRSIHLLAQNQVFERIFWTTVAAAKIDYFATLGHVFQCKIDADSDFAIKRVLKLWSDWTLAVQRNRPNNDLLRLHRIWLDQKQSMFVINQPRLIFGGNFYLVNRMSVSIEQPFFFECLPSLSYLGKSHRRSK